MKTIHDKEKERKSEILTFQRDMFWGESEKQHLIKQLLQKIYDLEDKLNNLKAS